MLRFVLMYGADTGVWELEQARRWRGQERAHLTTKKKSFARFARVFCIFVHFATAVVLPAAWNDLSYSREHFRTNFHFFSFAYPNSRVVITHFSRQTTLNQREIIVETPSYVFRWRSHFRRCRPYLKAVDLVLTEISRKRLGSLLLTLDVSSLWNDFILSSTP